MTKPVTLIVRPMTLIISLVWGPNSGIMAWVLPRFASHLLQVPLGMVSLGVASVCLTLIASPICLPRTHYKSHLGGP